MQNPFTLLAILLIPSLGWAQTQKPYDDKQNMAVLTDRIAEYPEGDQKLSEYVFTHVKYTDEQKKKYLEGNVTLSFDVLADSTVANCLIISGVGQGIDEQVRDLVKALKFSPAIMNKTKMKSNLIMEFTLRAY